MPSKPSSGYFGGTLGDKNSMFQVLDDNNVKYNKEKNVFITKDKSGQIIWLEQGNMTSGLQHILARHENDFKRAFNIQASDVPKYIEKIITKGSLKNTNSKKLPNGKIGYEKKYYYNGKYYMLVAIGSNGYIVSAYPISD